LSFFGFSQVFRMPITIHAVAQLCCGLCWVDASVVAFRLLRAFVCEQYTDEYVTEPQALHAILARACYENTICVLRRNARACTATQAEAEGRHFINVDGHHLHTHNARLYFNLVQFASGT
jgi:hypothetical protein